MRYLVSGRLREPCLLTPAEYVTLAIREWEIVVQWLAGGRALAYGRLAAPGGGALLLEAGSEAEARGLAAALPFAPYADVTVSALAAGAPAGLDAALDAARGSAA